VQCSTVWHTSLSKVWVAVTVVMKCILYLVYGGCFGCLTGYLFD
jgi:hypothetical protein